MKGLDWSNESYVRLYRADTPAWRRLHWEAQGVYMLVLRQLDRAGTMPLDGLLPFEAVAVMTGAPDDVAERSLAKILTSGLLEVNKGEDLLVDPEFLEREETAMSDAMRKRESRATRRDRAAPPQNVTTGSQNVTNSHARSRSVTASHAASRSVTPSLPCLALPSCPEEGDSSEPDQVAGSEPHNDVFITIPVVSGPNSEHPIQTDKIREWESTFPDLDVKAHVRAAVQWCLDSPAKRKTPQGVNKFIGAWLNRAQNSGRGGRGAPHEKPVGEHVKKLFGSAT